MPSVKISNTSVSKISKPPKGQRVFYWDSSLPGFGIKAINSDLFYIVQRRLSGRTSKLIKHVIGNCNEISAVEARNLAMQALANLRQGADLNVVKKQKLAETQVNSLTLQEAYDSFIQSKALRARTLQTYGYILNYTLSDWLPLPIVNISSEMILKKHKEISSSGIGGRGQGSANQVMRLLRAIFNFVIATKNDTAGKPIISENPVKVLSSLGSWNKLQPRNNVIKVDDLQSWYANVMKLDSQKMQDFFLLLMFSGLRRNEAARLQWQDVDTKNKILTIRAEISKTKIKRELPLTDVLQDVLKRRRANIIVGNSFIFTGRSKRTHLVEPKKSVKLVAEASGIKWSSHCLRRTYSTIASQLDISHYKLKALLGHAVSNDITSAHYVQTTVADLKEPAQKVANFLKQQMGMVDALELATG